MLEDENKTDFKLTCNLQLHYSCCWSRN